MTIAELAKELNASVPEVFEHYKKISVEIPEDENFVLSADLIKRAIPKYQGDIHQNHVSEINAKPKLITIKPEELKWKFEERKAYRVEILDRLEPYFKRNDTALLNEFRKHNSIPNLLFEGEYWRVPNKEFGFFKYVTHQNGTILSYPISNDGVGDIFIATGELTTGKRYSFETTLARKHERTTKANPFLLQAKNENIEEIKELSVISHELKMNQEKLQEINTYLEKAEEHFEKEKEEIEERIRNVSLEKYKEANETIEEYNQRIKQSFIEIQVKEKDLSSLKETFEETNNNILKMENLLNTLKDRVSLCRNLQFISEDDENKYLNLMSAEEFKPLNHLDFEKDFEKNFSRLSEHIHAYLFYKKNLIYTRYQIKNFLTLLKTHDIIVLSGLSGSGKTQIVKAFAEALGGVAKIIPVKPNWTSSDDLIGYYNPLQMSFLPTPFTEAIVEAIKNPNQLYFICLDEMNLARAEYYFADFLSKLEERSKQPEIELYANHEEELFVSEFSTLLNLIESSIKGKKIKTWQEFLDNEEVRKKFFEMLGKTDRESMLQLHAKMKRRLMDILKFPSTIKIPENIRFIGAINVDETTHYFSPKILDRIHVVKFDNPLLFEEQVNNWFEKRVTEKELKPVYISSTIFSKRKDYPKLKIVELEFAESILKEINLNFLIPLKIDFGLRSIRQSLNYYEIVIKQEFRIEKYIEEDGEQDIAHNIDYLTQLETINSIIIQKILPRFNFDGNDNTVFGKIKIDIAKDFNIYLKSKLTNFMTYDNEGAPMDDIGIEIENSAYNMLNEMIKHAEINNSQFNFFA
jgi:AAA domain (dynein-related subfamily)